MPYRLGAPTVKWVVLSWEDKPRVGAQIDGSTLTDADLPLNSLLEELDTGDVYYLNEGRQWRKRKNPILAELLNLRKDIQALEQAIQALQKET